MHATAITVVRREGSVDIGPGPGSPASYCRWISNASLSLGGPDQNGLVVGTYPFNLTLSSNPYARWWGNQQDAPCPICIALSVLVAIKVQMTIDQSDRAEVSFRIDKDSRFSIAN